MKQKIENLFSKQIIAIWNKISLPADANELRRKVGRRKLSISIWISFWKLQWLDFSVISWYQSSCTQFDNFFSIFQIVTHVIWKKCFLVVKIQFSATSKNWFFYNFDFWKFKKNFAQFFCALILMGFIVILKYNDFFLSRSSFLCELPLSIKTFPNTECFAIFPAAIVPYF